MLVMFALPADAGQLVIYTPGKTCAVGSDVALRFTVAAGSPTVISMSYQVGASDDVTHLWPATNWTGTRYPNAGPGVTRTYNTFFSKVFSTNTGGGSSWVALYTQGATPPSFSWIGWVCI